MIWSFLKKIFIFYFTQVITPVYSGGVLFVYEVHFGGEYCFLSWLLIVIPIYVLINWVDIRNLLVINKEYLFSLKTLCNFVEAKLKRRISFCFIPLVRFPFNQTVYPGWITGHRVSTRLGLETGTPAYDSVVIVFMLLQLNQLVDISTFTIIPPAQPTVEIEAFKLFRSLVLNIQDAGFNPVERVNWPRINSEEVEAELISIVLPFSTKRFIGVCRARGFTFNDLFIFFFYYS